MYLNFIEHLVYEMRKWLLDEKLSDDRDVIWHEVCAARAYLRSQILGFTATVCM